MHPPKPVPLEDVDLTDLDVFVRDEAWGMFDTLRREAPVFWNPEPGGNHGFWSVTRFADIEQVDKRPGDLHLRAVRQPRGAARASYMDLRRSMLETDGSRHQALRKLLLARLQRRRRCAATRTSCAGCPPSPSMPRCGRRSSTSSTRSPPTTRSTCWPGCSTSRRSSPRQLDLLGQRDRRRHRPGLRPRPASTARKPRSTSTCPSGRLPRWRSSSTAASSPPSAAAGRRRPGQQAGQPDPRGRRCR